MLLGMGAKFGRNAKHKQGYIRYYIVKIRFISKQLLFLATIYWAINEMEKRYGIKYTGKYKRNHSS